MAKEPSFDQRIEPGSFLHEPSPWPASITNDAVDAAAIAEQTVAAVNQALSEKNFEVLSNLFVEDGFWRDHVATSWHLRTIRGRGSILAFLKQQCYLTKVEVDASTDFRKPNVLNFAPGGDVKGICFYTRIATQFGSGRGVVRIVQSGSEFKIWTFFTLLEELAGHEEPVGPRRINGVEHGGQPDRKNWLEQRAAVTGFVDSEPDVLIVGAGQAGLTAHARLKMLGVSALIIDSNNAVGDNWRKRYHQLVLHDPVWYDHMPYMPFPDHWPVFTPKDKLADWLDSYAKFLELNVWMKSELLSSSWDDAARQWTVTIKRTRSDGQVETRTLHPKHIIQATGASGVKNMPAIPGMDTFQGSLLCHSADFPGVEESSTPKKVVIIGACNSSHDIAQDYYEKGHSVTMIQRSTTCVISSQGLLKVILGVLYEEGSPPVEDADIFSWSWPSDIMKSIQVDLASIQRKFDADLLSGLARAGFGLDNGPDNAGLFAKYLQRGGGYYIDVGTSKLIIDGKINVKHGQQVDSILPHGVRLADGTELEADEIILATGYANMRTQTRVIFGGEVADRVGDVWGWDEEGEMRTICRDSGHPGFWFHGGNFAICRYYSRVLALQIKAKLEGLN